MAADDHLSPVQFYHGTNSHNAEDIERNGLQPSFDAKGTRPTMTRSPEEAYYHAAGRARGEGGTPAVVSVSMPREHAARYIDHPDAKYAASLNETIPPQHLRVDYSPQEPGMPEHIRRALNQQTDD